MHDAAPMKEFLTKIAEILEVENLNGADDLKTLPQWDSLAVLSIIAMLDANYGVNLPAADLQEAASAAALWDLVQSRKAR
jgi:acyl carrier protein